MSDVLTQLSLMPASGAYAIRRDTIRAAMREISNLRAEVTAANERASKAESELNSHIGKQALKAMLAQMKDTARQRDELAAHVERLRLALLEIQSEATENLEHVGSEYEDESNACRPEASDDCLRCFIYHTVENALATTPAASLAALKAEALREASTRGIRIEVMNVRGRTIQYAVGRFGYD